MHMERFSPHKPLANGTWFRLEIHHRRIKRYWNWELRKFWMSMFLGTDESLHLLKYAGIFFIWSWFPIEKHEFSELTQFYMKNDKKWKPYYDVPVSAVPLLWSFYPERQSDGRVLCSDVPANRLFFCKSLVDRGTTYIWNWIRAGD